MVDLYLGSEAWSSGMCRFLDHLPEERGAAEAKIVLRCRVERGPRFFAILDTAAAWSILEPAIARQAGLGESVGRVHLATRHGRFAGALYRTRLEIQADEGRGLSGEATVWVSDEWPGPSFLGWRQFLESLRFAVEGRRNRFFFGRE